MRKALRPVSDSIHVFAQTSYPFIWRSLDHLRRCVALGMRCGIYSLDLTLAIGCGAGYK